MLTIIKNKILGQETGLKSQSLPFISNGFLTLGSEVELQLIDGSNYNLSSTAEKFLSDSKSSSKVKPEFYLSTIEVNTEKCKDVKEIEKDLSESFGFVKNIASNNGLKLATTGCHPFSRYSDCLITPKERYNDLIDRNQWLTRRMTVYGLHVHIGMKSGDECVSYMNFFLRFIPHLLALSASSPFWQGEDTGLASCRPSTYEALPTAGSPYWFSSWAEFEHLYFNLIKSKSITMMNDLWWDIRPSPKYGTVEIRVCDGVATLSETAAIVAFIHLLAHWFRDNSEWIFSLPSPMRWIFRENKWRAMRHGLNAEIIVSPNGDIRLLKNDIKEWVLKLKPYAEKLGYEKYMETILQICEKGNSADRQRKIYSQSQSLEDVVRHNTKEFETGSPIY